jgi:hypothetical protein
MLDYFLNFSLTLDMKVTCYSETSVNFQRTTWRYIAEDRTFQVRRILNIVDDFNYVGVLISLCLLLF